MRARELALLLSLLLAACGGDDEAGGSGPTPDDGGGPAGTKDAPDPVVGPVEPKQPEQPSEAAKRPALTEADFIKLSARTLGGFTGSVSQVNEHRLVMTHTTEELSPGGVKLVVHATLHPCDASACFSMDPTNRMNAQWAKQAREALERQGYEDAVFEVGRFQLAPGYEGFMHYQLGHQVEVREGGLKSTSATHGFNVRYHDGANAILLRVYKQGRVDAESAADLEVAMPRAMAERAARKVFGLYADLFEKGGR